MDRHNTGMVAADKWTTVNKANAPGIEIDPRLVDHAEDILSNAPLDDSTKADLWDAWHDAPNVDFLARRLADFDIPDRLEEDLVMAKKLSEPEPTPIDKALGAIHRLGQMDPQTLRVAETHTNILRLFVNSIPEE
jgi:hypothetical protein